MILQITELTVVSDGFSQTLMAIQRLVILLVPPCIDEIRCVTDLVAEQVSGADLVALEGVIDVVVILIAGYAFCFRIGAIIGFKPYFLNMGKIQIGDDTYIVNGITEG